MKRIIFAVILLLIPALASAQYSEAVYTYGTLGSGDVSGTYATLIAANTGCILDIFNNLDQDVFVSFDASTTHIYLKAATGKIFDLCANGIMERSVVSVKDVSAATSSGNIYGTKIGR